MGPQRCSNFERAFHERDVVLVKNWRKFWKKVELEELSDLTLKDMGRYGSSIRRIPLILIPRGLNIANYIPLVEEEYNEGSYFDENSKACKRARELLNQHSHFGVDYQIGAIFHGSGNPTAGHPFFLDTNAREFAETVYNEWTEFTNQRRKAYSA